MTLACKKCNFRMSEPPKSGVATCPNDHGPLVRENALESIEDVIEEGFQKAEKMIDEGVDRIAKVVKKALKGL